MSQTSNVFPSISVNGHFLGVFAWQLFRLCISVRQIFFYSCGIFLSNFRSFINPKGKKQQQNQRSKLTREYSPSPGLILLLRMDLTSSSFSLPEL